MKKEETGTILVKHGDKIIREIDKVTGVIINEYPTYDPKEKYLVDKKQAQAYKDKLAREAELEERKTNKSGQFIVIKNDPVKEILPLITIEEASALCRLILNLTMKSKGVLVNSRGVPLTAAELHAVMDVKTRRGQALLQRFKELEVLDTEKDEKDKRKTIYSINPKFHAMGGKIMEAFTKLYQEKMSILLDNKKLGNELGTFYKIIPYFHFQTFYFVWNPDVDIVVDSSLSFAENLNLKETEGLLQHIQLNEFAEKVLKIEPETFTRHLNALEKLKLIKRSVQGDSTLILIHPDFVYRKDFKSKADRDYIEFVKFQFREHKTKSNRGRKKKKSV